MLSCSKTQRPSDSMNDLLLSWHSAVQHTVEQHMAFCRIEHGNPMVVAASAAGEGTPGVDRQPVKRKRTGGQVLLSESEDEPRSPAAASDSESDFSMGKCKAVGMRSSQTTGPSVGYFLPASFQKCQLVVSALPACASFKNDVSS